MCENGNSQSCATLFIAGDVIDGDQEREEREKEGRNSNYNKLLSFFEQEASSFSAVSHQFYQDDAKKNKCDFNSL